MVKDRNEPCCMVQVLEVLAGQRNESAGELAARVFGTTTAVFFPQS